MVFGPHPIIVVFVRRVSRPQLIVPLHQSVQCWEKKQLLPWKAGLRKSSSQSSTVWSKCVAWEHIKKSTVCLSVCLIHGLYKENLLLWSTVRLRFRKSISGHHFQTNILVFTQTLIYASAKACPLLAKWECLYCDSSWDILWNIAWALGKSLGLRLYFTLYHS